ncbi:MAG: hypothetical protein Q9218_008297 [Villophora microphyllina]
MWLPDEVKLSILNYVEIGPDNTHQTLRRTHPWFRANIPTETLCTRLLAVEIDNTQIPSTHRVCYTCLMVLPNDRFADNSTRTPKGLGGRNSLDDDYFYGGVEDNSDDDFQYDDLSDDYLNRDADM